jgi:hypothetical protein
LIDWSFNGVEAVHATTCALEIHYVELLVQEGVKTYLSVLQSLVQVLEYLLVHVLYSIFALLAQPEEVSKLLL